MWVVFCRTSMSLTTIMYTTPDMQKKTNIPYVGERGCGGVSGRLLGSCLLSYYLNSHLVQRAQQITLAERGHGANPAHLNLYYQLHHNSSSEREDRPMGHTHAGNTQTHQRAAAISGWIQRTHTNKQKCSWSLIICCVSIAAESGRHSAGKQDKCCC